MRTAHLTTITLLVGAPLLAQDPDIFVAPLRVAAGSLTVGKPTNVTARAGYDNQPAFAPDGRGLYFTSTREDRQADIYRFDFASRRTSRITRTSPESEYSAAQIPGGRDLAVIRVERDSTQRLWRVGRQGSRWEVSSVILPHVKPAGYFVFADPRTVVLFVLGSPATLQVARMDTDRVDTVAVNAGRSLHRVPGSARVSFVSKAYEEKWWIMSLDPSTGSWSPLVRLPDGVEDYAWLPDGRLLVGKGSTLLVADPAADGVWKQIADLAEYGIEGITRLAVSPRGDRVALVGVPARR